MAETSKLFMGVRVVVELDQRAGVVLGGGCFRDGHANPDLQSTLPRQVAEVAMPFFLLHQPVILAIALPVVGTMWGIAAKIGVLLPASFLLTLALGFVVSQSRAGRPLFG